MAASDAGAAKLPPLPPISLAKLKEASELVERLVAEKTSVFLDAQSAYRAKHRKATERPLAPDEAAQVAAAMATAMGQEIANPGTAAAKIQKSGLRAYDEPDVREVLLAAGLATAPAFIDVACRLTALIEMPNAAFEQVREDGRLDGAIVIRAQELEPLDVAAVRARASRALDHFSEAAGVETGKAWGLIGQTVWQAMSQMLEMTSSSQSPTSSLVGSIGPDETSSTEPPGSSSQDTSG